MNAYLKTDAEISECKQFRYLLTREWESGQPVYAQKPGVVCFVMVNPSTADHRDDDRTVAKCVGYADRWGYSKLEIRNLYPFRSTDVKALATAADPEGGMAGSMALMRCEYADLVVCAWGSRQKIPKRLRELHAGKVGRFLRAIAVGERRTKMWCLGTTVDGDPVHPLMQPGDAVLIPFPPTEGQNSHVHQRTADAADGRSGACEGAGRSDSRATENRP